MADYDDLGVMQAQLGLGIQGNTNPVGIPTPMPQVRHPGEFAQTAVQMTQSAAMQTMQTAAALNPANPGGFGLGSFAAQYQANMANIRANQLSPFGAGMAASMMGYPGYSAGMMPSPVQMTSPSMGIYRQMAPPPMMTVPPTPPTPFIPGPFTPQLPPPMFTTSFERGQQLADYRGQQSTALALSVPGAAARMGADILGARTGAGLGALAGARLGGVPGAAIGGVIGSIGGMLGTEHFLGQGIQNFVDDMNPIARMSRQAAQVRGMSRDFVISGNALDVTGQGLNRTASVRLARQLHDLAGQSSFQRETGGMFSTQDLMKITQLSGQQGLLDVAQNPDQITGQVKTISKALKAFMKLAGEPDVTEAIKQLGQMRNMGLSLGESMLAVERAKSYGRMAGTSVQGVMQMGGLPGAMVFQQQGLSAGLGMQVGMGALGMARQAAASGAFTPQQLSMLGGVSGVAQNNMEMAAAMLKQPLMAAAMTNYNPATGGFQLNAGNVLGLSRGQQGIAGLANMGVANMMRAVQQGGVGALGAFQMDQAEMQDQLGRALGPEGIKIMGMQQILNQRRFLGIRGRGGLYGAAKSLGISDDQATQSVLEMGSPEFIQNMQRQIRLTEQQQRVEERERRAATAPGLIAGLSQEYGGVRSTVRGLRTIGASFGDLVESTSELFSNIGANSAARANGQRIRYTDKSLLASSPLESRMIQKMSYQDLLSSGVMDVRSGEGGDKSLFRIGGRGYTLGGNWSQLNDYLGGNEDDLKAYRRMQGGAKGFFGGGGLETFTRYSLMGGFGAFATGEEVRKALPNMQRGAESTARGLYATSGDKKEAQSRLTKALGGKAGRAMKLQNAFEKALAAKAKENYQWYDKDKPLLDSDYDEAFRQAAKEAGISEDELKTISRADLETVSVSGAKQRAGTKSGAFSTEEALSESQHMYTMDQATEAMRDQASEMFDDIGTRDQRQKLMETVLSGDEDKRVGILAALQAAATGGNAEAERRLDEYTEKLADEGVDVNELRRRAGDMATKIGAENADALGAFGQRLLGSSLSDMEKDVETRKNFMIGLKKQNILYKGLETFMSKSAAEALQKEGGDVTRKVLLKDEGELQSPELRALAKKFKASSDPEQQQKLLAEAANLIGAGGYATEAEAVGGETGESSVAARQKAQTLAAVGAEASEQFPDAVASFAAASRALEKAANNLGNATQLTPGVNNVGLFNFNF